MAFGPKPTWNSALAKALYAKGMTAKEIAEQFQVNIATVKNTATRHKWAEARAVRKAEDEPTTDEALTQWLAHRARAWMIETALLLNRATAKAASMSIEGSWRAIADVVKLLRDLVPTGRALYGLDKEQGLAPKQLAVVNVGTVNYLGQGAPAPQAQTVKECTIDVQQVSEIDHKTANQQAETPASQERDSLDAPGAGDEGAGPPFRPLDINIPATKNSDDSGESSP